MIAEEEEKLYRHISFHRNTFNTVLDLIQNGTPKETTMGSANNPQDYPVIFIRNLKDIIHK